MLDDRAVQAGLVTSLLNVLMTRCDRKQSGSGDAVLRKAARATKVSGSTEEEVMQINTLRASGYDGTRIWLSDRVMLALCEHLYIAMCQELGPVDADAALLATLEEVERDHDASGMSARKWF